MATYEFGVGTEGVQDRDVGRDVASAMVWLEDEQVQELAALVDAGDWGAVEDVLRAAIPELGEARLGEARWRTALREELMLRVSPPADDEQDDLETREMPDLTRFAQART